VVQQHRKPSTRASIPVGISGCSQLRSFTQIAYLAGMLLELGKHTGNLEVLLFSRYAFQLSRVCHSSEKTQRSLPCFIVFKNLLPILLIGGKKRFTT